MALAYFKYCVSPMDVTPFKSFPWIKAGSTEGSIALHSITYKMPSGLKLVNTGREGSPGEQYYLLQKVKEHKVMCEMMKNLKKRWNKKKKVVKIALEVWIAPHAKFTISDRADGWLAHDAPSHISHAVHFWQCV